MYDYYHHSLALYFRYCGSDFAGLVLRIKPVGVVPSSITCFLDGTIPIFLGVICLDFFGLPISWRICSFDICRSCPGIVVLDTRGLHC